MPKERSVNPAAAQRKADKQKEIAKNKKQLQSQRNEKLARRNPDRLQRQIDELKEVESQGRLRPKDKETLAQLERDVKGIRRARDVLGDAAPKFPDQERRDRPHTGQDQRERRQNLGKRRRDDEDAQESDTDPEARDIPMPRDTPPPLPREERRRRASPDSRLGPDGPRHFYSLPAKPAPPPPPQIVYSAAPQLRDLRKEAARFVPAAVAQKKRQARGEGRLLEPEEIDKLEQSGYYAANQAAKEAGQEARLKQSSAAVKAQSGADIDIEEEFKRFEEEIKGVYPASAANPPPRAVRMEEVEDDGN